MSGAVLPWQLVRVSGPSMSPTLRHGDLVVARYGAAHPGDVVLAAFADLPGRMVLKRAVRRHGEGWWLASDNPAAGGDSSVHGVARVHARVVWRWRRGTLLPRRVR